MATPPTNANGHRRRELRARVLAEETHCALCDQAVDKTLTVQHGKHRKGCTSTTCQGCIPHDMRAEVDEDLPRSRGGSPYERGNCRLMHRSCNRWKSTMTLAEAKAKLHGKTVNETPKTITTLIKW